MQCPVCNTSIHASSYHEMRVEGGGNDNFDNGQVARPCWTNENLNFEHPQQHLSMQAHFIVLIAQTLLCWDDYILFEVENHKCSA